MKRTVLGFLLFFIVFLGLFGCTTGRTTAEGLGQITFEVYDSEGVMVAQKEVEFHDGDTLIGLLQESFEVIYVADATWNPTTNLDDANSSGVFIMGLDDLTAFESGTYIAFYINDVYATTGVDQAEIVDGNVYQFKYETY